jgi:hypothetical protein
MEKSMYAISHSQSPEDNKMITDRASAITHTTNVLMALWGFVTSQEFAVFAGIVISLCSLLVTYHFKRKDEKRKQEIHALKLKGYNIEE